MIFKLRCSQDCAGSLKSHSQLGFTGEKNDHIRIINRGPAGEKISAARSTLQFLFGENFGGSLYISNLVFSFAIDELHYIDILRSPTSESLCKKFSKEM